MQPVDRQGGERPVALAASAFEALFSQGPAGMLIVARDLRILDANPRVREYFALPETEAAEPYLIEETAPPFPDLRQMLEQMFDAGAPVLTRVLRTRGSEPEDDGFWECSALPLSRTAHHDGGALVVVRDIGDRKHMERRLRESQARLLTALAASHAGTFGKRLAAGAVDVDQAFRQLWSFRPDEVLDIPTVAARIHPQDRERVLRTLACADRDGGAFDLEYRICAPDGTTRWLVEKGLTQGEPPERTLIGACVDITRQKQAEQALRDADRRKDEFLAMLAHELRNPLAPIRNVVDVLALRPEPLSETGRWGMGVIDRQVRQLTRLVDDLLDLSRISSGRVHLHPEILDMRSVVRSAQENIGPRIQQKALTLQVATPEQPVLVFGDSARLLQIVENLLDNAVKFTESGGRLTVSLHPEPNAAVLEVADTGIGIDPKLLPEVFDLFRQADQSLARPYGGLGVGLTLVQRLVALHHGSVRAQSPGLGHGSIFVIELPLAAAANDHDRAAPRHAPAPGLQALIVDDNCDAADALRSPLESIGHNARCAYDGAHALAAVQSERPDVVLLDIGLPDMDGFTVAEQLLARYPGLPLVALTGFGREEDRARCIAAGFAEHLIKPVDVSELEQTLARVAPPQPLTV